MQTAQVIGFMLSWFGMREAMSQGRPVSATPDASLQDVSAMTAAMGEAFDFFLVGIGIAVLGLILVIIAATRYRYRANWFFWFLCIYGAAMIMTYMFPFGLFFVIYAVMKKNEFDLEPPPEPGTMVR